MQMLILGEQHFNHRDPADCGATLDELVMFAARHLLAGEYAAAYRFVNEISRGLAAVHEADPVPSERMRALVARAWVAEQAGALALVERGEPQSGPAVWWPGDEDLFDSACGSSWVHLLKSAANFVGVDGAQARRTLEKMSTALCAVEAADPLPSAEWRRSALVTIVNVRAQGRIQATGGTA